MKKFSEKGLLILQNKSLGSKCDSVRFFEKALMENIRTQFGQITFEENKKYFLIFLNFIYDDAYFQISALEGQTYSRFIVAREMLEKLETGYGVFLGDRLEDYVAKARNYLVQATVIEALKPDAMYLLSTLDEKYGPENLIEHSDFAAFRVVCEPSR